MKKFEIDYREDCPKCFIQVEAKNEVEAQKKAYAILLERLDNPFTITDVQEIKVFLFKNLR